MMKCHSDAISRRAGSNVLSDVAGKCLQHGWRCRARPSTAVLAQKTACIDLADASCVQRRGAMALQLSMLLATGASLPRPAAAEEAAAVEGPSSSTSSSTTSTSSSSSSSSTSTSIFTPFYDNDYELVVPANYTYIETPIPVVERGPQPERSPVRARFDSPEGGVSISVLVRRAQTIQRTIFQVSDLAQYGSVEDVAKLLLPRGSTLLGSVSIVEPRASKETPFGTVDIPPRTYYLYEFTTTNGLHVAMSAAAQRGNVYVCGVSAPTSSWEAAKDAAAKVVRSFRIKNAP